MGENTAPCVDNGGKIGHADDIRIPAAGVQKTGRENRIRHGVQPIVIVDRTEGAYSRLLALYRCRIINR